MDEVARMIPAFMAFVVILVPVIGITARFALKPIVESIVELRRASSGESFVTAREGESYHALEREVAELRKEVDQLRSAQEFDRALGRGGENKASESREIL